MWGSTRGIGVLLVAFFLCTWVPCLVFEWYVLDLFSCMSLCPFCFTRPAPCSLRLPSAVSMIYLLSNQDPDSRRCAKAGGNAALVHVQYNTIFVYWVGEYVSHVINFSWLTVWGGGGLQAFWG